MPQTVPEHAPKVRFAYLTTHFVSVSPLLRSSLPPLVYSKLRGKLFLRTFLPITCRLPPQSSLTLPEKRPSLDEGQDRSRGSPEWKALLGRECDGGLCLHVHGWRIPAKL
jgi:hypothetical protein